MDFRPEQRRPKAESIVPMINVVFLLLVFFLMTAKLTQPEPFEVSPPSAAQADDPETDTALYVGKNDQLQFQDAKGEAIYEALSAMSGDVRRLQVRVDAELDGDVLAVVMSRLAAAGFAHVEVVVDVK